MFDLFRINFKFAETNIVNVSNIVFRDCDAGLYYLYFKYIFIRLGRGLMPQMGNPFLKIGRGSSVIRVWGFAPLIGVIGELLKFCRPGKCLVELEETMDGKY